MSLSDSDIDSGAEHAFNELPSDDSDASDTSNEEENFDKNYDDLDEPHTNSNSNSNTLNYSSSSSSDGDELGVVLANQQTEGTKSKKRKLNSATTSASNSKHAPKLVSSKRYDFFKRGAPSLNNSGTATINANAYKSSDPRMNSMSGTFDQNLYDSSYKFLDGKIDEEIASLKERIKAAKIPGKKGKKLRKKLGVNVDDVDEEQAKLVKMVQERSMRMKGQVERAAKTSVKRKMREQVKEGKGVFYLKRADERKAVVEAEYEELKKRGGEGAVKKALAKRRKKKANKDHKLMPPKQPKKY